MADGSVIIETKINTDGVEKGSEDISKHLESILLCVQNISSSVDKIVSGLTSGFGKANGTVVNLSDSLEATAKAAKDASKATEDVVSPTNKFDPSDISKLQIHRWNDNSSSFDDIGEISKEERKALHESAQAAIEAAQKEAEAFNSADEKVNEYYQSIKKIKLELKTLENSGKWWGDDEYDEAAIKLNELLEKIREYKKITLYPDINDTADSVSKLGERIDNLSKKLMKSGIDGIKNRIKSIGKTVDKLVSKLMRLTSGAIVSGIKRISNGIFAINKSANKSTLSIGKMLKTILKYSIGIRSLYVLLNKLRSAITAGFENLVQYDPSGKVNQSLSALKSSLTRLKNSFATAFAPILTAASPALVTFINLVSEAVTRVGMLIAALTGQKTFTKAIGVQENYASSLEKTADSAKDATKALKNYLSPLDEINRYDDGKSDSGTDVGGKYTGPSASDMFEEVPIANSIKGIADKIRKLIKKEDWEGLGKYIATGINKGLKKVYEAISWKKVGPKITKFCNAFTRTFNSLIDNIDWDLMGRTVGSGVNTIVNTLNLLITVIDWKNLGKKFANGITGFVREVNWNNLGQLIGNRFMIAWNIFNGIVHDLPYKEIGQALADGLNGAVSKFSLSEIGDTLATGLNGAFTSLYDFTIHFDWKQLVGNIAGGINTFIETFDWKGNGQKLEVFLTNLCNALTDFVETTDWEVVGEGIGDFLSQIDWWGHLKQVADAIKDTLDDLFEGLEESGTAGKIAAFLGKAFLAVKISDITGISSLVKLLVGFIGKKLIGSEATASLAGSLTTSLGKAASAAAGGFTSFSTALGPFVGAAGLCALLAVGIGKIATKVSSLIDSANGGNGTITDFGYTVDNLIRIMQNSNTITADQKNQLFLLKEQLEDTNASADEYGTSLADAMAKGKVSSDDLQAAVSQLKAEMNLTEDETEMLTSLLDQIGQKTDEVATKTADSATLSKEQWSSMKDSLLDLYTQGVIPLDDQLTELSGTLQSQEAAGATAEAAYNKMEKEMKNMGMTNENISTVLSTLFPEATMAVKTAVDTNIVGAQEQISSSMATAKADVEDATSSMASNANTNAESIKKGTDDSFKEVSKSSKTEWKDSYQAVNEALEKMEKSTLEAMKNIMGYIQSYWKSVVIDTNSTWELMDRKVEKALSNMASSAENYGNKMANSLVNAISGSETSITRILNNIASRVNSMVENINNSIAGIERGFTFSYNLQLPNGARKWGNYSLSLPRVNTVPYLAKGAVIPPRSEFLAVLGDQKQGNNIETPEALLRKIVREESGNQQGSSEIRVIAQINRRVLFDEFIKEAKARQEYSGKNPLELA